jgi:hypothetical protein
MSEITCLRYPKAVRALSHLRFSLQKKVPAATGSGQKIYILKKGVEFYYRPSSLRKDERNISVTLQMMDETSTSLKTSTFLILQRRQRRLHVVWHNG